MSHKILLASLAAAVLAFGAPAVMAQPAKAPPPDALRDPSLKGPEVIAFMGVKPGDKVADIFAGSFVAAFSKAVGPKGQVFALEPEQGKSALPGLQALAAAPDGGNITVGTISMAAMNLQADSLDEVFIRQNYHDLYDPFMGPVAVPAFNKQVFAALKPGGVFVVLDHSAPAGTGLRDTNTTHRIDEAQVKADMKAAGFVLDGESKILANPADDRSKKVFDPSVRGKTDQFLLKFRKPGKHQGQLSSFLHDHLL